MDERDDSGGARAGRPRGAAHRVRRSHAQAHAALRMAVAFGAAAVLAAAVGAERWLVLHLLLAGGVVLAISGVAPMLTVTWSAAPAPGDGWMRAQRWAIGAGATGVVVGRTAGLSVGVTATAAAVHGAALLGLAALLVTTVRRGVERRYDVAVAAYVAATASGAVGVALGGLMVLDVPRPSWRSVHITLNVLGLVGVTVAGTMPYFAATVGRTRMGPHATRHRLVAALAVQLAALLLVVVGLAVDRPGAAAAGFAAYAASIAIVMWLLPRPRRHQLDWAGPRLLALFCGATWWAVAVGATAIEVAGDGTPLTGRWLVVLVVAGYAQIVWGSLAYLLPVLRGGGHEQLSAGFATTRSWVGLVAANAAGAALACQAPGPVVAVAVGVWVLDSGVRFARVGMRRRSRAAPPADPSAPP